MHGRAPTECNLIEQHFADLDHEDIDHADTGDVDRMNIDTYHTYV